MRDLRTVYLLLAIAGTLVPLAFFAQHFVAEGFGPVTFVMALLANPVSTGFGLDLVISSFVFWVWMFSRPGPNPALFIVLNLCVGLSCALPAYLYMGARQTAERRGEVAKVLA